MRIRIAGLAVLLACTAAARKNEVKQPAETRGENESVVITAKVYNTPEQVKELLGSDLGGHYTVVAIEVKPRFGKHVEIMRDDFQMKTDKDGEKSTPFAPSQIAGSGVLVVRQSGGGGTSGVEPANGPIWGGIPGISGRPKRVGGDGATTTQDPEGAQAKVHPAGKDKENPMLAVLKAKELPETKTDQPVSGLLYFPLEKQKVKELELRYALTGDKITMRFKQAH